MVQGLMGITPDAQTGTISTLFKMTSGTAALNNLPVLQTTVNLTHINNHQSAITNLGRRSFKWKAMFSGNYTHAKFNGASLATHRETDKQGKVISWVLVNVKPGMHIKVEVKP